jgi:hypothetical protein
MWCAKLRSITIVIKPKSYVSLTQGSRFFIKGSESDQYVDGVTSLQLVAYGDVRAGPYVTQTERLLNSAVSRGKDNPAEAGLSLSFWSALFFLGNGNNHDSISTFSRLSWRSFRARSPRGPFLPNLSRFPLWPRRAGWPRSGYRNGYGSGNGDYGGWRRRLNYGFLFFACI